MRNLNRAKLYFTLAACLCALCLAGTPRADEAAAPVPEETASANPAAAAPTTETETAAAANATEAGEETPAASESAAATETPAAVGEEKTPAAATEAKTDEEKPAAPATVADEPAPGAAHPQEISIIPFKGYDLDGKRVDVGACIGEKPVLLVFWASWCPTCKTEVPHLNKLTDQFGDRMAVVGVNIAENDSYKRAKAFAARTDMRYPTVYDASQLLAWQYAIRGLPTVVVADKKGIIRYYGPGAPEITEETFAKLVED